MNEINDALHSAMLLRLHADYYINVLLISETNRRAGRQTAVDRFKVDIAAKNYEAARQEFEQAVGRVNHG